MNNQIQVFNFQTQDVRTIIRNGEIWFVAKDVCDILSISNHRDALSRLSDTMKGVASTDTLGGKQDVSIISESGLYKLVFTSRKPEAESFTNWLATEVLPSIRKHGMYATQDLLDNPDLLIQVATTLKKEREEKERLQIENQQKQLVIKELKPKADHYDVFIDGSNYQTMNDVAKVVGYGRNKLFEFLRRIGVLMNDNVPYQAQIEAGRFVVKESVVQRGYRSINVVQTYVTSKGVEYIYKKLREKGVVENAQITT